MAGCSQHPGPAFLTLSEPIPDSWGWDSGRLPLGQGPILRMERRGREMRAVQGFIVSSEDTPKHAYRTVLLCDPRPISSPAASFLKPLLCWPQSSAIARGSSLGFCSSLSLTFLERAVSLDLCSVAGCEPRRLGPTGSDHTQGHVSSLRLGPPLASQQVITNPFGSCLLSALS